MSRKLVAVLGALALLLAVLPSVATAQGPTRFQRLSVAGFDSQRLKDLIAARAQTTVIVQLAAAPVANSQAAALATGRKLTSTEKSRVRATVKSSQDQLIPTLRGMGARPLAQYQDAYDGIRIRVAASRIAEIAALPGVVAVHPVTVFQRDNLVGVPYIGGSQAWTDSGLTGQGVKIADIDTGIDFYHANFGGSGQVPDFAYGAAHSTTVPAFNADGTTQAFPSAKVAGGYDFVGDAYDANLPSSNPNSVPKPDPNPLDCAASLGGGHGSHTAGTAAGEGVLADGSTYAGPYTASALAANSWKIGPGVAPKATIYAYRVFGCTGSTNVVVDAIEMAMKDGVDVINMSLGSPFGPPDSPDAVAANNAALAGITVVASAGNEGPNAYIVGSPSTAARALSVAALDPISTFPGALVTLTGGPALTGIDANGASLATAITGPLKVLQDSPGVISLGCADSDYASVAPGDIVVALRGVCARVDRATFGQAHGAAAVIMLNNSSDLPPFEGTIPGVTIPFIGIADAGGAGAALLAADGTSTTISAGGTLANTGYQMLATFSSGGPGSASSAIKPEITAPGVSTLSTLAGGGTEGERLSGTSMAAPFTTGAAALVKQAHPTWTPAQIKGALISTADNTAAHILGYNVRTAGAGVVQVQKATTTAAMAWTKDGLDTLSFGYDPSGSNVVDSKDLTITNSSRKAISYTFSWTTPALGAVLKASPSKITVPARSSRTVNVKLTLSTAAVAALPSADSSNFGSLVTIRGTFTATPTRSGSGLYPLAVPYLVVPRGLSDISASDPHVTGSSGSVVALSSQVVNKGVHAGAADVYAWGLHDRKGDAGPTNDIRDVGVQSLDGALAGVPGDQLLVFAMNTYGRWSNASDTDLEIPIDKNGDGTPDFWVIGFDYGYFMTGTPDGRFASFTTDAGFNIIDIWIPTAPMNGSTAELPTLATDLGLTPASGLFKYGAQAFSLQGYTPDLVSGWASFDAFAPAFSQGQFIPLDPRHNATLSLSVDGSKLAAQPGLGWMVVALDDANGAAQADELQFEDHSDHHDGHH